MAARLRDDLPDPLTQSRSRPLFVMRLDVQPLQIVGAAPGVYRRIGVVRGGSFDGERLSGEVLEGSSDWQALRSDGSTTLDVRLVLKTTDSALIGMTYRGIRHGPPDVTARLEKGEVVDPAMYYFRMAPFLETASAEYGAPRWPAPRSAMMTDVPRPPIPCPFVYADGRQCTGVIRRARAYGPIGRDGAVARSKVRKYRLWCSEKDDHAGVVASFDAKQRMEFYPDQLEPGVEDQLWSGGLLI